MALYYKIKEEIGKILDAGYFESKYKQDKTKFEGYDIPTSTDNLIVVLNKRQWEDVQDDLNFVESGTAKIDKARFFHGVTVLMNNDIDKDNALIMHKDFLQFWILPQETRYNVIPYPREETTDYIYETMHTMDIIPIMCSMWVQVGN